MSWTMFELALLVGGCTGFLSHWLWYIHGVHDNHAGIYVQVYACLHILIFVIHYQILGMSLIASAASTTCVFTIHMTALFSSIVCYRLFFHPICHIKGPTPLRVSKIFHSWQNRRFDNYRYLDELHRKYGDVVRTGPNEVTLFSPEAFEKVHGPVSSCNRSVYYEAVRPLTSMVNTTDVKVHTRWRKVWDQAFCQKALDNYEPVVYHHAHKLVRWLDRFAGKEVDISSCFERFTFDVMGCIGLDYEFRLLDGQDSAIHHVYQQGAKILGRIVSIPWFVSATRWIPRLHKNFVLKTTWIRNELDQRQQQIAVKNSVIDHLIDEALSTEGFEANYNHLQGEWLVVMAAGIDPMLKCLTNMMWYLAEDPSHTTKIRAELSTVDSIANYKQLVELPHLNAVINETLRLNPAVPSAGARSTPAEGLEVQGVMIPGACTVIVPQYTLFRREDCFVRASEFIPERWTTQPEYILNKSAFQPWSSGRYNCVGKHLGLMEIRIAAALVIQSFDVSFAKGYDHDEMFDQTADHFVSLPGPLHVCLERRDIFES